MTILVCKVNALGDCVTMLPVLRALADRLPGAALHVLTTPIGRAVFSGAVPLASIEEVPYDEFRALPRRPAALWALAQRLRAKRADVALMSYDEPTAARLLARVAGIPERVGFGSGVGRLSWMLTRRLPFDPARPAVELNFDLARHVLDAPDAEPGRVPLAFGPGEERVVGERLAEAGIAPTTRFIAIHPFAKLAYKEWPLDRYLTLGGRLEERLGLPVVFVAEAAAAGRLASARVVSGLSVPELACLLGRAAALVGNNSGPMHVAAAMGTPTVAIHGPSPRGWDIGWSDARHRGLRAEGLPCAPCESLVSVPGVCRLSSERHGCLLRIEVDRVIAAVTEVVG